MPTLNRTTGLIITTTIIIIVGIGYLFTFPTYQNITKANLEISTKKEQIETLDKYNKSMQKISDEKSTIEKLSISSKKLIPNDPKLEEFLIELEALIFQSEIPNANFQISSLTMTAADAAKSTGQSVIKNTPSYQFTLDSTSSLENIIKLYNRLMTMNRLVEMTSIDLNSAASVQDLTFQLSGNVFSSSKTTIDGTRLKSLTKLLADATKKINNNKSYGKLIEIQKETGFGRPNPFLGY